MNNPGSGRALAQAQDEVWLDRYMPRSDEPAQDDQTSLINLESIRGFLFRQRYLIGAIVALALAAGLIVTLLMTPIYKSTATLRVEPYGNSIVEGQDLVGYIPSNEIGRYMDTLGKVGESRSLAYQVVETLNLDERPDLIEELATEKPDELNEAEWERERRETATDIVQGSVRAIVPLDERIITLEYQSENPVLAAEIANAYADNFVMDDIRRKIEANSYAQEYLQEQIADVRQKLENAETAANSYARQSGIVRQASAGVDGEEGSTTGTITGNNLASVNQTYTNARAARIAAEQQWLAVANRAPGEIPQVQSSTSVQALQARRSQLAANLADLRLRYNDAYPAVKEVLVQIEQIDREIATAGSNIKAGIRNAYQIALRQERALGAELDSVAGSTLDEQDRQVQFNMLERDATALRDQLTELLSRYNEVSTAANVREGPITKLDSAIVPGSPISPNLTNNLIAALFAGLGLALGLAVLREMLDDRLHSLDDVERKLGLPLLGHTPHVSKADIDNETSNPFGSLVEAYASVLSTLDYSIPPDAKIIQFTSTEASEGKSTTAMVISQQYAQLGVKTLLVDCDVRRPALHRMLEMSRREKGLYEVISGDCEFSDAVLRDVSPNLDVLPVAQRPDNPVELMSSQALQNFFDEMRGKYDRIILDSSPVVGIADAPLLSRKADATIFVLEANRVHHSQARKAIRRLQSMGATIPGIVLTKYRALQAGQSYGYQYSYYSYGSQNTALAGPNG